MKHSLHIEHIEVWEEEGSGCATLMASVRHVGDGCCEVTLPAGISHTAESFTQLGASIILALGKMGMDPAYSRDVK